MNVLSKINSDAYLKYLPRLPLAKKWQHFLTALAIISIVGSLLATRMLFSRIGVRAFKVGIIGTSFGLICAIFRLLNQYLAPSSKSYLDNYIDIEKEAPRFFFKEDEQDVAESIDKLITPSIHFFMTSDCETHPFYGTNFVTLDQKGKVIEHKDFKRWLMKGGGGMDIAKHRNRQTSANRYDNLMRPFMAERMKRRVKENNWAIKIPQKRLYRNRFNESELQKKYYVFSKKIEILSEKETIETLQNLSEDEQRKYADALCGLIEHEGFVDAYFENIRWFPSKKKLAIIDTESLGLLIEKSDKFPTNKRTIRECALIGLNVLKSASQGRLPIFAETANHAIERFYKCSP